MGDQPDSTRQPPAPLENSNLARKHPDDLAFHSQFEDLSQSHAASGTTQKHEQQSFDMRQMVGALPSGMEPSYGSRQPSAQLDMTSAGVLNPQTLQYAHQSNQYAPQRHDPIMLARMQQTQYVSQQIGLQSGQFQHGNRPQPMQLQTQHAFPRAEHSYAYGITPAAASPMDPRFQPQLYQGGFSGSAGYADMGQFARRNSEPLAAIPTFPRGPPRKPKQSGHALWVGNLPPAATVIDLKDHFSRDATKDIESLFLISKSNCAFVNYRSEAACVAAMNRFHDSRFHGVRLVCRLRRGSSSTLTASSALESPTVSRSDEQLLPDGTESEQADAPIIVGSAPSGPIEQNGRAATIPALRIGKVPEKFFIVKSLTLQDLEASVRNGIWATQSHNEAALNRAFGDAENVYLVFSANKSGEYFGYARMASSITGDSVSTGTTPVPKSPVQSSGPQSIPTAATETAPRGHIIDDSARGTIFWEAELSDQEEGDSPIKQGEDSSGQDLGRPFTIEWISTARLPFYRTRGLRNPWNANREVKIARDGTELEPSVGKRLIQMFHRPAPMAGPPMMQQGGAPYRTG